MKLARYLKPYILFAVLTPLAMVGEVFIDLELPSLMSEIVDKGVLGHDMQFIIKTGILMLIFTVIGGICGIGSSVFSGITSHSFARDLRNDAFSRIMDLSFEQTDKFTTGSLVTRMTNDITQVQTFLDLALRMFVRSLMLFVGGIVMLTGLNVKFGLVIAISMPVELAVIFIIIRKATPIFSVVQKKLDKVNSVMQENVSGARVVKSFVREDYEADRFNNANNDLTATNLRIQKLMAIMMPLVMIVLNFTTVTIIIIGGNDIAAKASDMQIGSVMAAVTYVTMILFSVMMLGMTFQMVSRAKASADRLNEIFETEPVIKSGSYFSDRAGDIVFENVSFFYPGFSGRDVLKNINFTIKEGENVAFLGSTGSGKTTLINLIPRFYDVSQGRITVGGRDVKDYDLVNLRDKISVVNQKTELFSGTVSSNIRWGREDASEEEIVAAATVSQAEEFIKTIPGTYEGYVAEKGASLSGGQKQRLSIARSIVKKPDVIILDDSTSALDLSTESRLREMLSKELKGSTVITIAQRIASVKNCDRIFVLNDGEILSEGTHEELLKTSSVYRDIYDSQVKEGDGRDV